MVTLIFGKKYVCKIAPCGRDPHNLYEFNSLGNDIENDGNPKADWCSERYFPKAEPNIKKRENSVRKKQRLCNMNSLIWQ